MTMKFVTAVQVILFAVFAQFCWAEDVKDEAQKAAKPDQIDPCSQFDRISMGRCLGSKTDAVDEELEKTLNDLVDGFWDEVSVEDMRKAQESWLKFIELDCKFQKPNKGGREWKLVYNSCLLEHKKERIRQLKGIPSCGNGCIHLPKRFR